MSGFDERLASTAVRDWCESKRVTYAKLAARCGMARSTLVLIATGKARPSTKHVAALARETGIPVAKLLGAEPDPNRPMGAIERARLENPRPMGAIERARLARKEQMR